MRFGELNGYFDGVGKKKLSQVEVDPHASNQHELNGVRQLTEVLGPDRRELPTRFIYLDDGCDPVEERGLSTWYDARENHPTRTEYRLYYRSRFLIENASAGDTLIVALEPGGELLIIAAKHESTIESQLLWLFGFSDEDGVQISENGTCQVDALAASILEVIGVKPLIPHEAESYLDEMLRMFPDKLPPCKDFSAYVRSTMPYVDFKHDDPDMLIFECFNREEALYRAYERATLERDFVPNLSADVDVDYVLDYAMSLFNTRKSRAGKALENHLAHIFVNRGIRFDEQVPTEQTTTDFIFPSATDYFNLDFPTTLLTMLSAKTSCKERWKQSLDDALRIERKHIVTMEPAISAKLTEKMKIKNVQLVVPYPIHETYKPIQQEWLWTVGDFCEYVKGKQAS